MVQQKSCPKKLTRIHPHFYVNINIYIFKENIYKWQNQNLR